MGLRLLQAAPRLVRSPSRPTLAPHQQRHPLVVRTIAVNLFVSPCCLRGILLVRPINRRTLSAATGTRRDRALRASPVVPPSRVAGSSLSSSLSAEGTAGPWSALCSAAGARVAEREAAVAEPARSGGDRRNESSLRLRCSPLRPVPLSGPLPLTLDAAEKPIAAEQALSQTLCRPSTPEAG